MKILILLFSIIITAQSAHAYLDPGSGSALVQVIAAIGFFFALMWRKIKRIFTGKKDEQAQIDKAVNELINNDRNKK